MLHPEARRLIMMLMPHLGKWVAVDFLWQEVIAASPDRLECIKLAKEKLNGSPNAILYKVPEQPPAEANQPGPPLDPAPEPADTITSNVR